VPEVPAEAAQRALVSEPAERPDDRARLTIWVRGRVQGVGMRWWIRSRALEAGLAGWARNLDDGRVEVLAEGTRDACAELLDLLGPDRTPDGRPGRVDSVVERWSEPPSAPDGGLVGFVER
jgi:acylphosphatase